MKMVKMKKYTRVGKLAMSPLGYDGSLPAVKKSKWTKRGPRLTSLGTNEQNNKELLRRAITAPRDHLWNGLRVKKNIDLDAALVLQKEIAAREEGTNKRLFASKTIPRSWKFPTFDSPW